MENKLLKILALKIDAINKNIDNLNYLNGELEKNNDDLDYINEKIDLFKENDILNFDQINREDFDKVLSMINPDVTEIFNDKTCNYDGIIYIIEGIRKSISLNLTSEQSNAITSFIEGLKAKSQSLKDTIANLKENKDRLPETDLNVLNLNLEQYQNIVSKVENSLYVTEIDEVTEALSFAESKPEEKADIYEFILKYNADIYKTKYPVLENEEKSDKEDEDDNLPEFNQVDIQNDLKEESVDNEDNIDNQEKDEEIDETSKDNDLALQEKVNVAQVNEEKDDELNTVELEDIIQKIDAKLKEMEGEEKKEEVDTHEEVNKELDLNVENNNFELPNFDSNLENVPQTPAPISIPEEDNKEANELEVEEPQEEETTLKENDETSISSPVNSIQYDKSSYNDVINKYGLFDIDISNNSPEEVDHILETLNSYNVLDTLKDKKDVLSRILSYGNNDSINELVTLVKTNLLLKDEEFQGALESVVETMPILLTDKKYLDNFKANLDFYKEKQINIINLFDNYKQLLIIDHDLLVNNYNNVLQYGITINSDNIKYLLDNKNILKRIDSYIEALGYEKGFLGKEEYFDGFKYINENPHKINNISRDALEKLRYSSEVNGKIYGSKPGILAGEITSPKVDIIKMPPEYVNGFASLDYGFIDRSEWDSLKEQIDNLSEFDMTLDSNINKLDSNYKKDDLKYKFNDVIISRIKTIRLYNFLKNKLPLKDALIVALTYNSVLKQEEYTNIENIVNGIVEGGN